jgi:putative ABC transport system substrate-binding protein
LKSASALLLAILVALDATPAIAQQNGKVYRLGILDGATSASARANVEALLAALSELGEVEGKNLVIQYLSADGDYQRLPELAAQMLHANPDAIVVNSNPAAEALHRATATVPIVMAVVGDPIGAGLVATLARPGGNITGVTTNLVELVGKRLELLKEVVPGLKRIAIVRNPSNESTVRQSRLTERSAAALGLESIEVDISAPNQVAVAIAHIASQQVGGVIVLPDGLISSHAAEFVRLAAMYRLPATYPFTVFVDAGGLMLYGPSIKGLWRRSAYYVDRIFKGTNPADLPVEEPTTYEFVLNLKTAAALGLKIPQSILLRADRVIR